MPGSPKVEYEDDDEYEDDFRNPNAKRRMPNVQMSSARPFE